MKTSIIGHTAFQSLKIELDPGETFLSEAGKMVRMSTGIQLDVTIQKKKGGIMGALKRLFAGDSFFFTTYTNTGGGTAEVVVAPTLAGNVALVELDGSGGWMTAGGSYLACGPHVNLEAKWQGLKGLLSGESIMMVHCTGTGPLATDAFGIIYEEVVDGSFTIDTGHVVAFEDTLSYEISKVGGSWITSFLSGEGLVINFKGQGRVLVQSHNRDGFGSALGPMLPERG